MKTLYKNGKIYTGTLPLAESFAVEDRHFVFVGSNSDGEKLNCDEVIDLNGAFVCAGFNDSHMHLLNFGQALSMAPLAEHTTSLEEMILSIQAFAKEHPVSDGGWIRGRGWNHDYFTDTDRMPNRFDLDRVSTEHPVVITRCCGHCLVVNSKALEICGITTDTPDPEGGRIGREDGEPDGRFYEDGTNLIYDKLPIPGKEEIKRMIQMACKALNSYGVTSSQTDDYCVFRTVPWQTVNDAYAELEKEGNLTVRVYEQSNFTNLQDLKEFIDAGCVTGAGTELFKIGPLKMLGDGSLGARTAYLSSPYSDDPTTCGIPIFTQEQMIEMVGYAHAHGMQVAIHSIGDRTMDFILNAVEKALEEHPRENHRHGIVHCQVTRPDQLERLAKMKMHLYIQSIFLDYDIRIIDTLIGETRAATSYNWKTLMKKGCTVSDGTDCPVELPDPRATMQCAITRSTLKEHLGPYLPQEAFTVQEALDAYTRWGAYASFEEDTKGKIEPGYVADFVILRENPFDIDKYAVKDMKILGTYLAGKKVFDGTKA